MKEACDLSNSQKLTLKFLSVKLKGICIIISSLDISLFFFIP